MKYFLLTFFLITSVSAGEIKPGNYYLNEFGSHDENSVIGRALNFLKNFKENKPNLAIQHCTEEALYDNDPWSNNFYYKFKSNLSNADLTDHSKIEVLVRKKDDKDYLIITIPNYKNNLSIRFLIKKINGKNMITFVR